MRRGSGCNDWYARGEPKARASRDVYQFTVPDGGQSVYLDLLSGPGGGAAVNWKVVNDATGVTVHSTSVANDRQVDALPAGDYRLEVWVSSSQERTGAYRLAVRIV